MERLRNPLSTFLCAWLIFAGMVCVCGPVHANAPTSVAKTQSTSHSDAHAHHRPAHHGPAHHGAAHHDAPEHAAADPGAAEQSGHCANTSCPDCASNLLGMSPDRDLLYTTPRLPAAEEPSLDAYLPPLTLTPPPRLATIPLPARASPPARDNPVQLRDRLLE